MLEPHGEIGRLYLAPEDLSIRRKRKQAGKDTGKNFTEGWVEFLDKAGFGWLCLCLPQSARNTPGWALLSSSAERRQGCCAAAERPADGRQGEEPLQVRPLDHQVPTQVRWLPFHGLGAPLRAPVRPRSTFVTPQRLRRMGSALAAGNGPRPSAAAGCW